MKIDGQIENKLKLEIDRNASDIGGQVKQAEGNNGYLDFRILLEDE
jgi:hypothetical protein